MKDGYRIRVDMPNYFLPLYYGGVNSAGSPSLTPSSGAMVYRSKRQADLRAKLLRRQLSALRIDASVKVVDPSPF